MVTRKRGLGKGISALIGGDMPSGVMNANPVSIALSEGSANESKDQPAPVIAAPNNEFKRIPVEMLQPGMYQPRRNIQSEALEELAQSIRSQGLMQPLVVRPLAEGKFEIIAGERRWRASQLASLEKVPCIVREVSDEAALALSIIENIQREDLTPIEQAIGLQRLKTEFDLTHKQIAESVGRSRAAVTNLLRLLSLHESVKQMLETSELEMGHARCLLSLEPADQVMLAKQIAEKQLSVRQTENLVRRFVQLQELEESPENNASDTDPDILQLQSSLSGRVGAAVKIHHAASGKGRLVIKYTSVDELEGILAHIR